MVVATFRGVAFLAIVVNIASEALTIYEMTPAASSNARKVRGLPVRCICSPPEEHVVLTSDRGGTDVSSADDAAVASLAACLRIHRRTRLVPTTASP